MLSVEEQIEHYGQWVDERLPAIPESVLYALPSRPRRWWIGLVAVGSAAAAIVTAAWVINRGSEQSLDTIAPAPTTEPQQVSSVTAPPSTLAQPTTPTATVPPYKDESGLGGRDGYAQVWTGRELVVIGGRRGSQQLADGAAYDPASRTMADYRRAAPSAFVLVRGVDRTRGHRRRRPRQHRRRV